MDERATFAEKIAKKTNDRLDWLIAALEYFAVGNCQKAQECRDKAEALKLVVPGELRKATASG